MNPVAIIFSLVLLAAFVGWALSWLRDRSTLSDADRNPSVMSDTWITSMRRAR
jgi:hypothetical protein